MDDTLIHHFLDKQGLSSSSNHLVGGAFADSRWQTLFALEAVLNILLVLVERRVAHAKIVSIKRNRRCTRDASDEKNTMFEMYAYGSKLLPLVGIFEQDSGEGVCGAVLDDLDGFVEMVSFDVGLGERYGAVINVYARPRRFFKSWSLALSSLSIDELTRTDLFYLLPPFSNSCSSSIQEEGRYKMRPCH